MIHLKRASAGSGKTYALTKSYIRYLISYKKGESPVTRRIRNKTQLRSVLPTIMAVTFTNKATAEMQQRIVARLADLALADLSDGSPGKPDKIEYLDEFKTEFNATEKEIAEITREALREILLHYSDFNVSTIDTFFQRILHTFAYEVNLDDNFNLEIDTEYITKMGLNVALDSIADDIKGKNTDAFKWIRELINDRKGTSQWNIFQKKDSDKHIYGILVRKGNELATERFKNVRDSLEKYFEDLEKQGRKFSEVVKEFDDANIAGWRIAHNARKTAAENLKEAYEDLGYTLDDGRQHTKSRISKCITEFDPNNMEKVDFGEFNTAIDGFSFGGGAKKKVIKGKNVSSPVFPVNAPEIKHIDELYRDFIKANDDYNSVVDLEKVKTWKSFRKNFPYLFLILEIARCKREYLEATNSFEISETNSILKKIIGKDETPFIYERIGSFINNYLIDEFQDTSKLQWDNFLPLLRESESRNNDNLIIGDAKQSIYRFRNADYKLITTEVEKEFRPNIIESAEDVKMDAARENTNYRSELKIVQFNNFIFNAITQGDWPWNSTILNGVDKIYADCVQNVPAKSEERGLGYVRLEFYTPLPKKDRDEEDKVGYDNLADPGFKNLPELIVDLISRGYRQRDIGILVTTNKQGEAVVERLMRYNNENPKTKIKIVSEQSLLVKSSTEVKLIIHALEKLAKGTSDAGKPSLLAEKPVDEKELFDMVGTLQSMSIPSLVEAIIEKFIVSKFGNDPRAKEQKQSAAPFLAAFQDAVLDYSAHHSNDIGSFLKWWSRKGENLAITVPESADGVRIMTIHKSKGLEFKCVIMPNADLKFEATKPEWRWINPRECSLLKKCDTLPEFIPVNTDKDLTETPYKYLVDEYKKEVALDTLNAMYVAFTRAEDELYVFSPLKGSSEKYQLNPAGVVSTVFDQLFETKDSENGEKENAEIFNDPLLISQYPEFEEKEDSRVYTYGKKLDPEEVEGIYNRENKNKGEAIEILSLDEYNVEEERVRIISKDSDMGKGVESEEDSEADDEERDPRSEGTRKHKLMEYIIAEDDLPKALRRMRVKGFISAKEEDEWRNLFADALESVSGYGWFDPTNRVYNERTFLTRKVTAEDKLDKDRRPDRMIVRPDGSAVIIDFKFGEHRSEHKMQVQRYMRYAVESNLFKGVEGYIWYVTKGKVVKV